MKCKYCSSKNIGKAGFVGKSKNKQRYRCKKCKRFSYDLIIVERKKQDIVMESKPLKEKAVILEWIKERIMNAWKAMR